MYGYPCDYCNGTVRAKRLESEAFKHKRKFVILEDVTIGVCDSCGNRYYAAELLHAVRDIATGVRSPERTERIPVAHFSKAPHVIY